MPSCASSTASRSRPRASNWGYINDPEFDKLAAEARSTSDPAELDKVLAKINTRMVDEAVFVWFVHDVCRTRSRPR